jgi:hypothetical protein
MSSRATTCPVTQTVTLHLSAVAASALVTTTAQAPGYRPTAYGFLWDVSVNGEQQPAIDLLHTAAITLSGISEEMPDAALLYWDSAASAWVTPPQDCIPTQHASRFTFHASPITSFTAQLCRSGRYGLFAPGIELFLPMVAR